MTTRRPGISVVYPVFNEQENIERAVHFAEAVLTDITSDYEILIVNDASTDRSAEIALWATRPKHLTFRNYVLPPCRNATPIKALETGLGTN